MFVYQVLKVLRVFIYWSQVSLLAFGNKVVCEVTVIQIVDRASGKLI